MKASRIDCKRASQAQLAMASEWHELNQRAASLTNQPLQARTQAAALGKQWFQIGIFEEHATINLIQRRDLFAKFPVVQDAGVAGNRPGWIMNITQFIRVGLQAQAMGNDARGRLITPMAFHAWIG